VGHAKLLTTDQIYELVLASQPPPEFGADVDDDLRELKVAGRFSTGAKILLNRLQANPGTPAAAILEQATEFRLKHYEVRPLMLALFLLSANVSFKPELRMTFATIPSRGAVLTKFADQTIDLGSIRKEVVANVLDRLDFENDIPQVIQRPRLLLALGDLNVTEFFAAYFAVCARMAIKESPGGQELTVLVPDVVMHVLTKPYSSETLERGLDFLLGDCD
jgi:hypothetical protein